MRVYALEMGVASFFIGVAVVPFAMFTWGFVGFLLLVFSILFLVNKNELSQKIVLILFVTLCLFTLGYVRYKLVYQSNNTTSLHHLLNKKSVLEGVIVAEPETTEKGMRFIVGVDTIDSEYTKNYLDPPQRILVRTGFYPRYEYGDRVQVTGVVLVPENFQSENGKTFNYQAYLGKDKIYYLMNSPVVALVSKNKGGKFKEIIFAFKRAFLEKLEIVLPEPQSALAGGLVLGVKQSLGKELEDKFREVGLIHIVVLSGYNVTIIAEAFIKSLSFLPKHIGTLGEVLGIVVFAIITGGTATVVRSSVMALILLLGRSLGRDYDALRALFVAGFFMVLHNPHILLYDPSFQLSFLATLGLMLVVPYIEDYFLWVPDRFELRSIFTSTISTQLFVLPYLLYQIGELSIVGLAVNILVLPFIPLTMLCVFITGMSGFFIEAVSRLFSYVTYLFLAYEIKMVEVFARIPFASVAIKGIPLWAVFVIYVIYALILYKMYSSKNKKIRGN